MVISETEKIIFPNELVHVQSVDAADVTGDKERSRVRNSNVVSAIFLPGPRPDVIPLGEAQTPRRRPASS